MRPLKRVCRPIRVLSGITCVAAVVQVEIAGGKRREEFLRSVVIDAKCISGLNSVRMTTIHAAAVEFDAQKRLVGPVVRVFRWRLRA